MEKVTPGKKEVLLMGKVKIVTSLDGVNVYEFFLGD